MSRNGMFRITVKNRLKRPRVAGSVESNGDLTPFLRRVTVTVTGRSFRASSARDSFMSDKPPATVESMMRDCSPVPEFREAAAGAPDERLMSIAEVAKEFGLTLRALRFYEAKHLISPQRSGAARLYRGIDRDRLSLILTGRRLGFTLAEIGSLLKKPSGQGLNLTREQCVAQINLLEQQKRGIEAAIADLRVIYSSFYRKLLDGANPAALPQ